jgi:hypothetical protein
MIAGFLRLRRMFIGAEASATDVVANRSRDIVS